MDMCVYVLQLCFHWMWTVFCNINSSLITFLVWCELSSTLHSSSNISITSILWCFSVLHCLCKMYIPGTRDSSKSMQQNTCQFQGKISFIKRLCIPLWDITYSLYWNTGVPDKIMHLGSVTVIIISVSPPCPRELSELHKLTAVNKTVAHEALLSAEQTARQELTEMMEKQRVEAHCEKEKLLLEVYTCTYAVSHSLPIDACLFCIYNCLCSSLLFLCSCSPLRVLHHMH